MRRHALGILVAAVVGCTTPPPSAYVASERKAAVGGVSIGKNSVGESCTEQAESDTAGGGLDIYCGSWQQPSAHARRIGQGSTIEALQTAVSTGPWRAALDLRYACADPTPTRILGSDTAMLLRCTRRSSGWPQFALVALIGDRLYAADGVQPSLPVMERAIGVLSGRVAPDAADAVAASDSMSQLSARMSAQAFSAGDVGQYYSLMRLGTEANYREDFAAAATAFRAALFLQQKALGADNPNTVAPLIHLALQDSDLGHYNEADTLFTHAEQLAGRSEDPTVRARLLHYRALHAINQGQNDKALELLGQAEAAYAAQLPSQVLSATHEGARDRIGAQTARTGLPGLFQKQLLLDAQTQALIGVVETRRNRANVLQALNRIPESEAASTSARELALANGLQSDPGIRARLYRTSGAATAAAGDLAGSYRDFAQSALDFHSSLPRSRPAAETDLLAADGLLSRGDSAGALKLCRGAIALLRELRSGAAPNLLLPCLDAFALQAEGSGKDRQKLLREMFEASQLAQGSVTSQQIAEATARLSESARDPKAGDAIRRKQEANATLNRLYLQRDQLTSASGVGRTDTAELDRSIASAQSALAEAEQALQSASPNLGQLVQQVAPTSEIFAALRPNEAMAAIVVAGRGGWTFLLHDGTIEIGRVAMKASVLDALVKRFRESVAETTAGVPRFDVDASRQLYLATLGPVESALAGTKSLVVVPTGALLSVPFATLLTGDADPDALAKAPWLVRRMSIAHVPAAANFVALRKLASRAPAPRPWVGFGNFRPATLAQASRTFPIATCGDSARAFAGLPSLPYAQTQLEVARLLLGAGSGDEFTGPVFTVPNVVQAPLQDYRVVHFAAHGLLPSDLKCLESAAIVTSVPGGAQDADGALLTAFKVIELHLNADLVILSACNSGGPGDAGGESLSGLARAFFYGGARSMMVTHWEVNDQIAGLLVARTLQALQTGKSHDIADALRQAELAVLDGPGQSNVAAHPIYWAPFALIGDGAESLASNRSTAERGGARSMFAYR